MYVLGMHLDVVGGWMMFAGVVSTIKLSFCPEKMKKMLCMMTFKPLEVHIHCF